jgi:hypothetical protein
MAHAWVEVYLEGYGWHIIEATPTHAYLMNPEILTSEPLEIGNWSDASWREAMQNVLENFDMAEYIPNFEERVSERPQTPVNEISETEAVSENNFSLRRIIFIVLIISPVPIILSLRVRLINRKIRRAEKLPPNEQVKIFFLAILNIVTYYTKPMMPDETPKSYGKRMGKRFAYRSDSVFFRDLIALYNKSKFSSREITPAEAQLMQNAYHDMLLLLRQMRLRPVYFYLRYIRGV